MLIFIYYSSQRSSVQRHPEFGNRVEIVRDMALYIRPVQTSDSGLYTCTVTVPGRVQEQRRQVYLNVKGKLKRTMPKIIKLKLETSIKSQASDWLKWRVSNLKHLIG
jgi:uncharacterized membrane protein